MLCIRNCYYLFTAVIQKNKKEAKGRRFFDTSYISHNTRVGHWELTHGCSDDEHTGGPSEHRRHVRVLVHAVDGGRRGGRHSTVT